MGLAMRHPGRRWLAVALAAAILLACASLAGDQRGRTVYYQVTYADGRSRDLSAPPAASKGIRRVLRIARIEQGSKGYEVLATGPQPLTLVSRGQTYKTDLVWNGKAWVVPTDDPEVAIVVESPTGSGAAPGAARAEADRLQAALIELAAKLLESERKLEAAERALAGQKAAAAATARARTDIRACLAEVLAGARKLSAPAGPAKSTPPAATGEVTAPDAPPPAKGTSGVGRPIGSVAVLPHRVQVWKLPAGTGERTCRVSVAHPEAGPAGAFHYVAYADTTGDGRADKLIARSPLAVASRAGQWTQWSFSTAERQLFVGRAWLRRDTVHYHAESIRIEDWDGLSTRSYVAVDAWGLPVRRWGPCYGNIRVWTSSP